MLKRNFYLPEQQIEALGKLAKRTGISVSEHVRRAISAYLSMVTREWYGDVAGSKETAHDEHEAACLGYEVNRAEEINNA